LEDVFYDDEIIGRVHIRRSGKAKCIGIRIKEGNVILTIPQRQRVEDGIRFLQSKRDWILPRLEKRQVVIFDENTTFRTFTFELKITKSPLSSFHFKLTPNLLTVVCPQHLDIRSEASQAVIRIGVERAMRMEAKRILPERLALLAGKHQFSYSDVNIRSSKSRWGSCSSRGNISLSYFLMTLPGDLIDYVLLHELCHTKEMNHSSRFWKLMDLVTDDNSEELRTKLKKHRTSF
jgi:predicted metal-dependent hydrolase